MKILLFLPILCLCAAFARAQSPSPAAANPPAGPLLRAVPDCSQWEITFRYPDDRRSKERGAPVQADASRNARPRKTVTTKTGRIVHEQQTDVIDRVTEWWFDGPTQYYKTAGDALWLQLLPDAHQSVGMATTYRALPPSGYHDLEWINETTYVGTILYGQGNCLVFAPKGARSLDLSDPAQRPKLLEAAHTLAYVDADTRLPLAVKAGGVVRTFVFDAPPTQAQRFPADLAEQIKKAGEGRARLELPAARPY